MQLLIIVTAGLVLCILVLVTYGRKLKKSYDALYASYHDLETLNSTLRMQRHDYLNHLQVVYGLIELGEYTELKEYLTPVYRDIMKTGKAMKTAKPAINALLSAKMAEAENSGIHLFVEVRSDLKKLEIPDWELCKVLSNIIDNGMTALQQQDDEDRKMMIDITETPEQYRFAVSNNGPEIPKDKRSDIFLQGYTSKKEQGHGMGLFIVNNVCRRYKGSVTVDSNMEQTTFQVTFPK